MAAAAMLMECVLCSALSCLPGYYYGGCSAGSRSDASCLPCENGPAAGLFDWTSGCNFECASGFYRVNGTLCMPCAELQCSAGFYASNCTDSADTECLPCATPVSGGSLRWTSGCDFVCADGYYFVGAEGDSQARCVRCSVPACFPGFRSIACTLTEDAHCVACDAPGGGAAEEEEGYVWSETTPCEIQCVSGFFLDPVSRRCVRCSSDVCLRAGTFAVGCTRTSDARCLDCPEQPTGFFAWVSNCSFACISGLSWRNGPNSCAPCSAPACAPGTYASACTPLSDSVCVPCPSGDGRVWTDGCAFGCLPGFFFSSSSSQCVRCSSPVCAAGTRLRACTTTGDAACVPCDHPPVGRFAWTEGCNFSCAGGSYLGAERRCVDCTTPWCAPGTRAGPCSATADAVCVACDPPGGAAEGSFVWTGDGECAYECVAGRYFMDPELGACTACSSDGCEPGYHRVRCTPYSDAVCEACVDTGDVGGTVWTRGCEFVCNDDGFYLQGGSRCAACSLPVCALGWYPSECNATADSVCTRCPLASYAGVRWTGGCWFECNAGYYRSGDRCAACTPALVCGPGKFALPCGAVSDSVCVDCAPVSSGPYEWSRAPGGSCQFVCSAGFFKSGNSCLRCSDNLACSPGFRPTECSALEDARCVPCVAGGGGPGTGAVWSVGCSVRCVDGFFASAGPSPSSCSPCTPLADMACPLGFFPVGCNATRNTACAACDAPGVAGSFVWVGADQGDANSGGGLFCKSRCCCGYHQAVGGANGSSAACVPIPNTPEPTEKEPLAFVVVSTALAMNNSVDTVCDELSALLQALSSAMNAVLGGGDNSSAGLCFVTNATAFNGVPCAENNVCPQCAPGWIASVLPTSGRRLLSATGGGVDLATVSTSTTPVPSSVVAVTQPNGGGTNSSAPLLATGLQTALVASLAQAVPGLAPLGVAAAVSSIVVPFPTPRAIKADDTAMWVQIGTSVGIVLLLVAAVCVFACVKLAKEVRLGGSASPGRGAIVPPRSTKPGASAELVWMPSIRLRQRSQSRERGAGAPDV